MNFYENKIEPPSKMPAKPPIKQTTKPITNNSTPTTAEAFATAMVGIDLGGTKIAIGGAQFLPEGFIDVNSLIETTTIPTSTPELSLPTDSCEVRDRFVLRMAQEILLLMKRLRAKNFAIYPSIGLGSPGNIQQGIIHAETTPQLGSAFDNFNLAEELAARLNSLIRESASQDKDTHPKITVTTRNDALAQMSFGISELIKDQHYRQLLNGKKVAYIGPGTGLGGGFAKVTIPPPPSSPHPIFDFFTDGHIGDIIMGKKADGDPIL
ncbi:MAG: ROK family protein, partial [Oligoflexia bacterium]|nr:ROK family protein [Oligoflexia bacterium]